MQRFLLLIVFAILFFLQVHNIILFPPTKGFDAGGHTEYIELFKNKWRVPLANEGWELYQPPLYYFLVHFLPSLKAVQWFGFLLWLFLFVITFVTFYRLFSDTFLANVGAILVAALPVVIYLTPTISNEFFSAVIIALTFLYYFVSKKTKRFWPVLGLLLGLSLLAKATALILLTTIFLDLLQAENKRISFVLTLALAIGGWFYVRNAIFFGNLVATSVDFPQYAINQPPGYRDIKFFIDLSGLFKFDLFRAHWYSFIPGTYFSFFYDGHNVIVPIQEFSKAGALLVVASFPITFLFLKGLFHQFIKPTHEGRIFMIFLILLFLGYIAYNLKLPFYSTVKGSFLVSGLLPFGYYVVRGLKMTKVPTTVVLGYLLVYSLLVFKNFWILDWWY